MKQVFIALGTNIEPRKEHIDHALESMNSHEHINVLAKSSIYETAPMGYTDQAHFLNMVLEIETSLSPIELLDVCQAIEQQLGRKRTIRFGPRTIDLDILVYDQIEEDSERLTIPHPRMHERAFVLIPLEEITPNVIVPTQGSRVIDLMKVLPESDINDVKKWMPSE